MRIIKDNEEYGILLVDNSELGFEINEEILSSNIQIIGTKYLVMYQEVIKNTILGRASDKNYLRLPIACVSVEEGLLIFFTLNMYKYTPEEVRNLFRESYSRCEVTNLFCVDKLQDLSQYLQSFNVKFEKIWLLNNEFYFEISENSSHLAEFYIRRSDKDISYINEHAELYIKSQADNVVKNCF